MQSLELLQVSNFDTREGKELLRNVIQSYRDPNVGATFKFEKLELIFNDQLSREVRIQFSILNSSEIHYAIDLFHHLCLRLFVFFIAVPGKETVFEK